MSDPATFGQQVKRLRQEHGLTQDVLAERVGCATQTIRKIEGGQRRPSFQIASRLAEELGVAPERRASFIRCSRTDGVGGLPEPHAAAEPRPAARPPQASLPVPLTRLIGRGQDVADARDLLLCEHVRLLTLLGPGGAGKTRLGLEVAAGLADHFADGVVFVDLVPIRDPDLVVPTIADAAGAGEEGGRTRLDRLKEQLRAKRLLLVLDNFEQVTAAAGPVADLLSGCPGVKVLVTSRELLRVRGERVFAVQPLPVPTGSHASVDELLAQSAAVQLFAERAAAARPDFALTSESAPAVAELCRRVDGLPLAIELAAARCTLFPPQALLARLGSRLRLLTGGPRDAPLHQQTLRSTIAWSYDLLTPGEQRLFRRLSVFAGGCTLDTIEEVCAAAGGLEAEIVDEVASLVEKSLLCREAVKDGEPWFRLLETIREYGEEQLQQSGEAEATRRAHAHYYRRLVEQAERHLWGREQARWLERLELEHDNVRCALAWHLAEGDSCAPAIRMAGNLWRFWDVRGHWTEGQRWLEQALARRGEVEPADRWVALHGAGNLALDLGEYARAQSYYEESLHITQQIRLPRGIANSLLNLSMVALYQGDLCRAIALQEQALAIHRSAGNTIGIALALANLAAMYEQRGDVGRAAGLAEECLARYTALGDRRGLAWALHTQALLAQRCGAYDTAWEILGECRAIYEELGAKNDLARVLNDMGKLASDQGEPDRAQPLYDASLRLAADLGDRHCQSVVLGNLGRLAQQAGDEGRAAALYSRSLALRRDPALARGAG